MVYPRELYIATIMTCNKCVIRVCKAVLRKAIILGCYGLFYLAIIMASINVIQ